LGRFYVSIDEQLLSTVNQPMALHTQRDQILGCVIAKAAPRPNVMNL
jgi:hypothetical protein